MKRILSVLLAVCLLCTPVFAASMPDLPEGLFNTEQIKQAVQKLMDDMKLIGDQIGQMSDAELDAKILEFADKYHIPPMNEEQMAFIRATCRGFSHMQNIGDKVDEYGEKISGFRQTMQSLMDTLQRLVDSLQGVLEQLSGLLDSLPTKDEPQPAA